MKLRKVKGHNRRAYSTTAGAVTFAKMRVRVIVRI